MDTTSTFFFCCSCGSLAACRWWWSCPPLQAGHQHHGGRLGGQVQALVGAAHQRLELVVHHADQSLAGGQRADHLLADGLLLDLGDGVLHHRQRGRRPRAAPCAPAQPPGCFLPSGGPAAEVLTTLDRRWVRLSSMLGRGLGRVTWVNCGYVCAQFYFISSPPRFTPAGRFFWRTCVTPDSAPGRAAPK